MELCSVGARMDALLCQYGYDVGVIHDRWLKGDLSADQALVMLKVQRDVYDQTFDILLIEIKASVASVESRVNITPNTGD